MKKLIILTLFVSLLSFVGKAQDDEYIGTIKLFAGTFCPSGYMYCEGQTLQITQYQALYSLLGNIYGGDGHTTFCLPDLRGRVVVDAGQGAGLSNYNLGQKGGSETIAPAAVTVAAGRGATASATGTNYNNVQPYLVLRYIICVNGLYPTRD